MPKTKSNVAGGELVVAARVSFRNADNAKWMNTELKPEKVVAEVSQRITDEFPQYAGIAKTLAEEAVAEHAKLWGFAEAGLDVTHYSGVLMFIGSPAGQKLAAKVGADFRLVEREAFVLRRKERREKLAGLTGGKVVSFAAGQVRERTRGRRRAA